MTPHNTTAQNAWTVHLDGAVRAAVSSRLLDSEAGSAVGGQGLFITDSEVEALLARSPVDLCIENRLDQLRGIFGLTEVDVAIIVFALAPDVDPRYERLYAYLQDNVTLGRPTVGLCLELAGQPLSSPQGRNRFREGNPLRRGGLITVSDPERPMLSRTVQVAPRVVEHLLGDDQPEPDVERILVWPRPAESDLAAMLARGLEAAGGLAYMRLLRGADGHSLGAGAFDNLQIGWFNFALDLLPSNADVSVSLANALREAALVGRAVVVGPIDGIEARWPGALRTIDDARTAVIVFGQEHWEPNWTMSVPFQLDAPPLTPAERADLWRHALGDGAPLAEEVENAVEVFSLDSHQVQRAARSATAYAAAYGAPLSEAAAAGSRAQGSTGLNLLATHISPRASLADLVLTPEAMTGLEQIVRWIRFRHRLFQDWKGGPSSNANGVTALFAGPPGTGKTLAAEAVAGELGLDLYTVDLSRLVDKYIGETEKNLERVFVAASSVNALLFFDEADSIFGKRSAVRDSHDRFANLQVSYLLQRMEQFDGVTILATNLGENLDRAFARRINIQVRFEMPDRAARRTIWERHLPPTLPLDDDVDLDFISSAYELSGGHIRNAVIGASYSAAATGTPLSQAFLLGALKEEYHKLGRLWPAAGENA